MKSSTFAVTMKLILVLSLFNVKVIGQTGVLDPNDPIVVYNPAAPPATPSYGTLAKWVKTNRVGFNTDSYKAYYYKGLQFRLKFPKSYQHGVNDGKKYPLFIFFHGIGERGSIYDNEYQLYHGGELHMNAVDQGKFDGFLLYPQSSSSSGFFSTGQYDVIRELIENYLVPQVKVDINRIMVDGLSGGGVSSWSFVIRFPQLTAASLPISAAIGYTATNDALPTLKFTPIWQFQGGLDEGPTPENTQLIINNYRNAGAQISYTLYPDQGHGCWYSAWNEPDYFPFMLRAHKANPWPLTGRTEFCPGDPINVTMGVTAGFTGYEWRKNGVVIAGANSNQITVTEVGVYDCRIKRGTEWSVWSPRPVEIKIKQPTVTPPVTMAGLFSKAIPALDTTTGVTLQVPAGYASYQWTKTGSGTVIGTQNTYKATTPGGYRVQVTEQFGCSSAFSDPFYIVDANGAQKPDVPGSLSVTSLSKTSLRLDWVNTPAPQYNEENFEIYQASSSAGPYKLIAVTAPDIQTFTVTNLNSNSTYFYKMRAVNSSAASGASNTASGNTQADVVAPTSPMNLRVTSTSRNSVSLKWDAATDDVGVTAYEVFVDGVKAYTTTNTELTVYNLTYGQNYNIRVRAKDFANNLSPFSNQVTAQALLKGLNYKCYTFTGTWNTIQDLKPLTPVKTGITPNVTIAPRTQDDNFAFLWEGFIRIPVAGTYTFRTSSDDGSKLYLSAYDNAATALVNNDGLHGTQDRDGTITLAAGVYPISITFYEQGGGEVMNVSWSTPQTGGNFVPIPDSVFADAPVVTGNPPAKPSGLTATALTTKSIQLNWTDNSNNETGFEIYRSVSSAGPFETIGVAPAGSTSYIDSTLSAATTYYYRLKAIGQYGESAFDSEGPGIGYEYYEVSVNALPDFSTLTPAATGRTPVISISPRLRNDNFAFKFSGIINIPTTGSYTFTTASDDGSRLYIDGFDAAHMVVDNDGLHGTVYKSASVNLTAGPHQIYVTFFELGGGEVLLTYIQGPGMSNAIEIPASMLGGTLANATTLPLPGTPAAPANLVATGSSYNSISLTWNDQSDNESGFEIYRAPVENGTYVLVDTVAANTTSFEHVDLSPNTVFYYKVRAFNLGGNSTFSNSDSAATRNHAPVLAAVPNQVKRYDAVFELPITATDEDGGVVNISMANLPAFASFTQGSNGAGTLTLQPVSGAEQGTYNFEAIATDQFGGADTIQFSVVINDNHTPVLAAVSPVTLNETQSTQFTITATDADAGDHLTWTFTGLPAFATTTINGASVTVNVTTGYADHGVYPVKVKATDDGGAFDTTTVIITVNNVDPNKRIYVNVGDPTYTAPAPWNNTAKTPVLNDVFANLKDATGATTPVSLTLLTTWTGVNNLGSNTGNNSGVYPDAVLRSSYYTNTVQQVRIGGLALNYKYKLTFLASRANPTVAVVTAYGVGATSVSLNAANNSSNVVSIDNLTPNASGQITFTVQKASGSTYGYLNALVIDAIYDDGTAPAKARDLTAAVNGNAVQLNWTDAAYNESSYEVYRATNRSGAYTLINTAASGTQTYQDATVLGGTTYYYSVKAVNAYGFAYSDTVSVTTQNISPVISAIANVAMNTNQVVDVPVTATDTQGDIITLQATGLPAFATFTDNGNGTGLIHIAPGSTAGVFPGITVTATDNHNASASKQFSITVTAVITGTPVPANVKAYGLDRTRISIEWTGVANTSYEVWRSGTPDGTFAKVGDVAAGGNNFINTGLTTGAVYYYKVRALLNGVYSDYSVVIGATTVGYVVNTNFNDGSAAGPAQGGNWNNLNALVNTGFVLPNLINDAGQTTGINLGIARNFSGFNSLGATTGNNSGVVPDNVMKSFYYCNYGDTAQLLISGLNLSHKYNFTFFGSRANPANGVSVVSVYKIGNQTVTLNAANNTSNVATIYNIVPDGNGTVLITILAANSGGFGYLNSLTISGIPYVSQPGTGGGSGARMSLITAQNNGTTNLNAISGQFDVNAYPNPFVDDVTLKFDLNRNVTKFTVLVIDVNGRIIHRKDLSNVPAGVSTQKLDLRGGSLNRGIYFIKVVGIPELNNRTLKVFKKF